MTEDVLLRATLAQAPDTLLRTEEAVRALPMDEEDARNWLARQSTIGMAGVYRWGDLQAALVGQSDQQVKDRAVHTWKEAARLLGVSEDTLARRRKKFDPEAQAYFASTHELKTWYGSLRPKSPKSRRRPRKAPPTSDKKPIDFGALARELSSGR